MRLQVLTVANRRTTTEQKFVRGVLTGDNCSPQDASQRWETVDLSESTIIESGDRRGLALNAKPGRVSSALVPAGRTYPPIYF